MIGLQHYLLLSVFLFSLGVLGVLLRRNILIILMSIELMLLAANIAIVAFLRFPPGIQGAAAAPDLIAAGNGMVFVFLVMTVSAAEVGAGLAVLLNLHRQRGTINAESLNLMKG